MWPLGEYERLVHEIKRRKNKDIPITFGILIADYRQSKSKEYILNYIERFNYKSGENIDFYLPGYLEEDFYSDSKALIINDKTYYFNENKYMDFLYKLEVDFDIDFVYTPHLILLEYDKGNFKNMKRIIIALDKDGNDIEQTGELFEKIFEICEDNKSLSSISKKLMISEGKKGLLDTIVGIIDNNYITSVYDDVQRANKYRIKKIS